MTVQSVSRFTHWQICSIFLQNSVGICEPQYDIHVCMQMDMGNDGQHRERYIHLTSHVAVVAELTAAGQMSVVVVTAAAKLKQNLNANHNSRGIFNVTCLQCVQDKHVL